MKNMFKARIVQVLGVIALVAAIGLSMAACDNEGGGDNAQTVTYSGATTDGSTYLLTITENTARYTEKLRATKAMAVMIITVTA